MSAHEDWSLTWSQTLEGDYAPTQEDLQDTTAFDNAWATHCSGNDMLSGFGLDLGSHGNNDAALDAASSTAGPFPILDQALNQDAGFAIGGNADWWQTDSVPGRDVGLEATGSWWVAPKAPCVQCVSGGMTCNILRDDPSEGQCTSCTALGWKCSLGGESDTANQTSSFNPVSHCATQPWGGMAAPEKVDAGGLAAASNTMDNFLIAEEADLDFIRSLAGGGARLTDQDLVGMAPVEGGSHLLTSVAEEPQRPSVVDIKMGAEPRTSKRAEAEDKSAPKGGTRFSRDSVRILKDWLLGHSRHPYPTDDEKSALIRQTGLSKVQITNWLANARRRGVIPPPRTTSPVYASSFLSNGVDVPARRGTPALETMNPLQRWANSPPENEPASVTDIARAVTASSSQGMAGYNSPYLSSSYADDGSGRSLFNGSSASSGGTGTSRSSGSSYSHASRGSFRSALSQLSHGSGREQQRRRRRKNMHRRPAESGASTALQPSLRTFHCTFCTETFRTKHDWQRHEKSLHLSLERWACALAGPRCIKPDSGAVACVFCGEENPDDAHVEAHNYSTCVEKNVTERMFFRKDHLSQHLRLVHNVKYVDWAMKDWKMAAPEIVSRCGFCSARLESWPSRIDHLADHFKNGKTMESWKGDWGFESSVLNMVENAMPPYRIHEERKSPYPYVAGQSPPESPRSAYDLIKLEMDFFRSNYVEQHSKLPSDDEMQIEACRIIFASELLSIQGIASELSWFRDLIMGNSRLAKEARFAPLRNAAESRLSTLKINGKDNLFERCMLEQQLLEWVTRKTMLGLTAMDDELQHAACAIVGRIEEMSTFPSEAFANWIVRLVLMSKQWLCRFRQRAHLPRSEDLGDEFLRSSDPNTIDSTIHSYSRLERELADYLETQRRGGVEPSDKDLQRQACIIIYEFADEWNQTAADNEEWLAGFRARHVPVVEGAASSSLELGSPRRAQAAAAVTTMTATEGNHDGHHGGGVSLVTPESLTTTTPDDNACSPDDMFKNLPSIKIKPKPTLQQQHGAMFVNAGPCDRVLAHNLRRWVLATISPNNPTSHVPSDAELQYQARWSLYDSDDEWNNTPADNPEWLRQFKISMGIATAQPEAVSTTTPPTMTTPATASTTTKSTSPVEQEDYSGWRGLGSGGDVGGLCFDLGLDVDLDVGMDVDMFGPLELDQDFL